MTSDKTDQAAADPAYSETTSRAHMAQNKIFLSMIFFLYMVQLSFPEEQTQSVLRDKLYQKLFSVYKNGFLPRLNESEPVKVSFDFVLINIKEVDSKEQTITVYGWVRQLWHNPFLRWNQSEYGGIDTMYISPENVWVPDILLYNNVDLQDRIGGGVTTYKTNVLLTSNGRNLWRSPAVFKTVCDIDVTYYPFDMQTCFLKFGSWALDSQQLVMRDVNITAKSDKYVDNGEWKLIKINSKKSVEYYNHIPFDDVTITLVIVREYFSVFVNLIIPCMLISTMIFLGFILPPECGERIGLSITVLLAMTVFQQLTSSIFPSFDFPLLGQYYFATSVEISISLVATTIVLNFAARKNTKMPRWLKILLLDWIARVVCLRTSVVKSCPKLKGMEPAKIKRSTARRSAKNAADQCVRKDDRLVQELNNAFVITKHFDYGGLRYANDIRSPEKDNCLSTGVGLRSFELLESEETLREGATSRTGVLDENGEELGESELALRQWEWIIAARILDRALLWAAIIAGIITFFAIFLRAPRLRDLLFGL